MRETIYNLVSPKSCNMKTSKLTVSFILLLSALFFSNCTKDQHENYASTTREIITQGKWSVEYFYGSHDLTTHYSNFQFQFSGNGTLTARSNNQELNGTWSMIRDVERNDVLNISINTGDPILAEINHQWKVTIKTLDKVSMSSKNSCELKIKKI